MITLLLRIYIQLPIYTVYLTILCLRLKNNARPMSLWIKSDLESFIKNTVIPDQKLRHKQFLKYYSGKFHKESTFSLEKNFILVIITTGSVNENFLF